MTDNNLFHYDAETAILNIIFKSPDLIYNLSNLKPYMFSSLSYSIIYSCMLQLIDSKYLPDYSLVKNKLESDGSIDSVGGVATLQYIVNQTNKEENIKEFERQIVSSYKAKTLLSSLSKAQEEAKQTGNVDNTIMNLKTLLDGLEDSTNTDITQSLSSVMESAYSEIVNRINNPGLTGLKFGIKDVDNTTSGINPGELWIIAARPSIGKTALACNSAINAAKAGIPILYFSQEMNKQAMGERLLAIETGIPLTSMRVGLKQDELNSIASKIKEIKALPFHIDCNFGMSLNYMISTIRQYHKHHNIKIVYLDYIQLIAERDEGQTAELGRISRALKLLAGELNIGIVIMSQLNRLVEMRDDKRPILSDLRQSGNLEEDADIVVVLYRDEYYNEKSQYKGELEFIIRKNRSGPTGTIKLKIDLPSNKITSY